MESKDNKEFETKVEEIFDYNIVEKFKKEDKKKKKEIKKENIVTLLYFLFVIILSIFFYKIRMNEIKTETKEIVNSTENNNETFTTYPIKEMLYIGKEDTNIILFDIKNEEIVSCVYTLTKTNTETIKQAKKLFDEDIVVGSVFRCGGFEDTGTYHIVDIDIENIQKPTPYKYSLKTINGLNDDDVYNSKDWLYIHSSQTNYKGDGNTNIERQKLWENFLQKSKNGEKCFIKIADNTNDGLILTLLFFNGEEYFVIEDDSRIFENTESEIINNDIYYFTKKQYLEELKANDISLWYLTNEEKIGEKLLQDGTLSSIISGNFTSLENEIDMFWLWTDTNSYINKLLASEKEVWKNEYKDIFPYVFINWTSLGEDGTSFIIGEGENAIIGTTGGKVGEEQKEELNIANALIYKEKEPLYLKNDCNLIGLHTLQVDLSSMIAICKEGSDITISISEEHLKNKGIKLSNDTTIRIKLWNGVDVGKVDANPSYIDEVINDSVTFTARHGLTFGEVLFESNYGTCSWNFAINGK